MRVVPPTAPGGPTNERLGLLLSFVGVSMFAVTLSATRLAIGGLAPEVVGLGQTLRAAALAALYLLVRRAACPCG